MKVALCGCMMQEPGTIERIQKSYRFRGPDLRHA